MFQRTPAWVVPKRDHVYSERARRLLRAPPARAPREPLRAVLAQRGLRADGLPRRPAPLGVPREAVAAAPARSGHGPGAAREAHAALPVRLQAHPDLRRLLVELRAPERGARHRPDRGDRRAKASRRRTGAARGRRDRLRHGLRAQHRDRALPRHRARRADARRRLEAGRRRLQGHDGPRLPELVHPDGPEHGPGTHVRARLHRGADLARPRGDPDAPRRERREVRRRAPGRAGPLQRGPPGGA